MATFYAVVKKMQSGALQGASLELAANALGHDFVYVVAAETDLFNLPQLVAGDMLFRTSMSKRAQQIEQQLLRTDVGHIYENVNQGLAERASSVLYNSRAGLPIVKSILLLPTLTSDLDRHIEYLGGFPIVVKVMGGSNGVGVIKTDSIESFKSLMDFITPMKAEIILRSFVPHTHYARLIVVGDEVVGAHCTYVMDDEFRTNAPGNHDGNRKVFTPTDEMVKTAVAAVQSTGVFYGGVDLLMSENEEYLISEVNTPCFYSETERITGVDISSKIVSFLAEKAAV
jgi:hypothetical protein